jgi:hypothetical protein
MSEFSTAVPSLTNPLPFGAPANYQGGIGEDLLELGFQLPAPKVSPQRVPGDGHAILPHVATFQSIVNLASRTYLTTFDEALRDNRENARVMRYDPVIMSALRDRQVPVTQLPWHIEADDESDSYQKMMVTEAKKIFQRIPTFLDVKRWLLEAIWFGKYGIQMAFDWDFTAGFKRMLVTEVMPVMGDKIVFTFGGRPGFLVHGAYQGPRVMTDMGMAHLLTPVERQQVLIHTFEPEDADLMQGDFAGQRFGYGVRGRIYWWWWQRNIVTQWMFDFLQTIGVGGLMVYYYEEGNAESLAAAAEAANTQQSSQAILMPRRRNLQGGVDEVTEVDRVEASTAGVQLIYDVIVNYFNQVIRDYILMERLTTRTGSTGLGSGVSSAHERTAADRQKYDAESMDETLTRDLLWVIQRKTWPKCPPERAPLRFVSEVDKPDPEAYMRAAKMFMDMGGTVAEDPARAVIGFAKPKQGEPILAGRPVVDALGALPGGQQPGGALTNQPTSSVDGSADRGAATSAGWDTKNGVPPSPETLPEAMVATERPGGPIRMARDNMVVDNTSEAEAWAPSSVGTPIPVVEGDAPVPVNDAEYRATYEQAPTNGHRHVPMDLEGDMRSGRGALEDSELLAEDLGSDRGPSEIFPPLPQGMHRRMQRKKQPSEAQKEAGNYKKKHVKWNGFDISVENVKGSIRSGKSKSGKAWRQRMTADYGYIKRTTSDADGDHMDIFLGPHKDSTRLYVVNQVDPETGDFDEHKIVAGCQNERQAERLYLSNYEAGWKGLGSITEISLDALKEWLSEGDTAEPLKESDIPDLVPANWKDGKLTLTDGSEPPPHIKSSAIPKTWTEILLSLNGDSSVWLTATESGQRRTVYNPKMATGFARTREAMHHLRDIPDAEIVQLALDDAVEPPFTRDDLLAALVTRLAGQMKRKENTDMEDHVRKVSADISKQVGVPARTLVEEFINPAVWG